MPHHQYRKDVYEDLAKKKGVDIYNKFCYIYIKGEWDYYLKKNEKVKRFAHILAGCIILVHVYEKYDDHQPSYVGFLVLGILFLLIALQHHRLIKWHHYIDRVFLIIEAISYGFIAADYFNTGKKVLSWCCVLVAIAYIVVALVKYRKSGRMIHETKAEENNTRSPVSRCPLQR